MTEPRKKISRYAQLLRDPRWQRKRLEIMQRDDFTCQFCLAKDQTLNVHHRWYTAGADPWDYPDIALVTLCQTCHEQETFLWQPLANRLVDALRKFGVLSGGLAMLVDAFESQQLSAHEAREIIHRAADVVRPKPQGLSSVVGG